MKKTPIKNNIAEIDLVNPTFSFKTSKPINDANIILDSLKEETKPMGSYFIDQIIIAYALKEIIDALKIKSNLLNFNWNNSFLLVKYT